MDLALFDFDGTITDGDTYSPFLRLAGRRSRLVTAALTLWPLVVGYRLGWVSGRRARTALSRFILGGEPAERIRALGARYARDVIPRRVRPEMLARIAWHRERGDRVVVVSASLDAYLDVWCQDLGLELICTELEVRDDVVTGRYRGGDCCGPEKAARVRARCALDRHARVYAYGDTHEDLELLALADEAYFRGQRRALTT